MLDQSLLGGDLEDLVDLQVAESLDIDGTPFLVCSVIEVRVNSLNLIVFLEVEGL